MATKYAEKKLKREINSFHKNTVKKDKQVLMRAMHRAFKEHGQHSKAYHDAFHHFVDKFGEPQGYFQPTWTEQTEPTEEQQWALLLQAGTQVQCITCSFKGDPSNMVNVYEGEYQCQQCAHGL